MTSPFAAAEEIQLLLPENQPETPARLSMQSAWLFGAALLLVAVPLGLGRVTGNRRSAEAGPAPTAAPIRSRA